MYLMPAESKSDNNVSEPRPRKEIIMTRLSFETKGIKARLSLVANFLDAANQMLWHGKTEIWVPHENMPKYLYKSIIDAQRNS